MDSSVFLHAYLQPMKKVPPKVEVLKGRARAIVKRISEGEEVTTSLVHISEISNILEARASLETTIDIISGLFELPNLRIVEPTSDIYQSALEFSRGSGIGINDSLAHELMELEGISEIYSFDADFDRIKDLKRVFD
ncbi:MAG: type II toxin-antitoxin system VapC family toxin [Nitrososphaerales archaeon]